MALPAYASVSLAEFKRYVPVAGSGRDEALEEALARASLSVEHYLGRRLVYRAPAEVEGAANLVAEVTIANGALTLAAQPNSAGRTVIVTVIDADRSITAGTVTVTGTVGGVAGVTEVFDLVNGLVQHGLKFFTAIASSSITGLTGAGAGDKVKVGSSLGYVEYHTPTCGTSELLSMEYPLRNVLEVNEDSSRTYGSATQLVTGEDFITSTSSGLIRRVSGSGVAAWMRSYRAIKLVYTAGYRAGDVPQDIRTVVLRLAALLNEDAQKGRLGASASTDALGNFTRFTPAVLSDRDRRDLSFHVRYGHEGTGERDFDLEAA